MKRALALVSLLFLTGAAPFENSALDGEAFSRPMPGLDAAQSKSFHAGSGLFRQAWVIGPSQDHPDVVGLGPLYNRLSCIACHVKNGRGAAPGDEGGVARAMVLRLSAEDLAAALSEQGRQQLMLTINQTLLPNTSGRKETRTSKQTIGFDSKGGEANQTYQQLQNNQ